MAEFNAPTRQEFAAITRRTVQTMKHQLLGIRPVSTAAA